MAELWILAATLLAGGVALVGVGAKQRAGTLRRNWFVGLRTPQTMRSDAAWQAAHSATAGLVTAAGIVQIIAAVALVLLRPDESRLLAVVLTAAGLTVCLVLAAGIRGHTLASRADDP